MSANRIAAVVWKEWHETFRFDEGARPVLFRLGIAVAFIVAFAWRKGADFGRDASSILLLMEFTILPTLPLPPDAFAGERERHTLETLLASNIDDRDIFLGKMLAILGIGVVFAVLACAIDLLVVTFRFSTWHISGVSIWVLAAGLVLGALAAANVIGIGVLISLRSRTVRGANMVLGWSLVGLFLLGSNAVRYFEPQWAPSITHWMTVTPQWIQFLAVAASLGAMAGIISGIGLTMFDRKRLIQPDL
jgi:ABC-2 type transport system permease protein